VWGLGRAIALWGFNVVQQFGADIDCDQFWSVLTAEVSSYPRKAGLVQIAKSLTDLGSVMGKSPGVYKPVHLDVNGQVGLVPRTPIALKLISIRTELGKCSRSRGTVFLNLQPQTNPK
jgi:hypothetical protein